MIRTMVRTDRSIKSVVEDEGGVRIDQEVEVRHGVRITRGDIERPEPYAVVAIDQFGYGHIDRVVVPARLPWLIEHRDLGWRERTLMHRLIIELVTQAPGPEANAVDVVALVVAVEHESGANRMPQ